MNDPFTARVRSAAIAGWWTVLIAYAFAVLLWTVYRLILAAQPAWFLSLCGPDITWGELQRICLWAIAAFKLFLWVLVLAVIWLTLWGRQLKKSLDRG
jgi:hypothetical protein